jgi:hypothetical protein
MHPLAAAPSPQLRGTAVTRTPCLGAMVMVVRSSRGSCPGSSRSTKLWYSLTSAICTRRRKRASGSGWEPRHSPLTGSLQERLNKQCTHQAVVAMGPRHALHLGLRSCKSHAHTCPLPLRIHHNNNQDQPGEDREDGSADPLRSHQILSRDALQGCAAAMLTSPKGAKAGLPAAPELPPSRCGRKRSGRNSLGAAQYSGLFWKLYIAVCTP